MGKGTHEILLPPHVVFQPVDIFLQFISHGVKIPGQVSEFISGYDPGTAGQISITDFSGGCCQPVEMTGQSIREKSRRNHAEKHHSGVDDHVLLLLFSTDGIDMGHIKPGQQC